MNATMIVPLKSSYSVSYVVKQVGKYKTSPGDTTFK